MKTDIKVSGLKAAEALLMELVEVDPRGAIFAQTNMHDGLEEALKRKGLLQSMYAKKTQSRTRRNVSGLGATHPPSKFEIKPSHV